MPTKLFLTHRYPPAYGFLPDDEEDFNFVERFASLKEALEAQIAEEDALNKKIA